MVRGGIPIWAGLLMLCAPARAYELHGRVVDRGTLDEDGKAKGVAGVKVMVVSGKQTFSAVTGPKGQYRLRKLPVPQCRATYRPRGYWPAAVTRVYALTDSGDRDVYLDAQRMDKGVPVLGRSPSAKNPAAAGSARAGGKDEAGAGDEDLGYYGGLARGFLAASAHAAFFREDAEDSSANLGADFGGDSSLDRRRVLVELMWAEFLAQDRPLETRHYLASALAPRLDSLGWGPLAGMDRYLEVSPADLEDASRKIREASRAAAKKMPTPADLRKQRVPLPLAGRIASNCLAALPAKAGERFRAKWKKAWGKAADDYVKREAEEWEPFRPSAMLEKLAVQLPKNPAAHFLNGRNLFLRKKYSKAAEELDLANRMGGSNPAARYLEAMSYLQLGRNQEALGRFQALREATDPAWKAKGYFGLGMVEEKEKRNSEAAADLWKSVKLVPDPQAAYLLAKVSLRLNDVGEIEKLLQGMAERNNDHQAHYWLGKYAQLREQPGVAEDHFRKAWAVSPLPEYGEALGRMCMAREEYRQALGFLIPLRGKLSREGREQLADCLLQEGEAEEARKEYAALYPARPSASDPASPRLLGQYVEALLQCNRADEALAVIAAYPDPGHPAARLALAKAGLRNQESAKARVMLEELVRQDETNAENHFLLGLAHFQERNFPKAKKEFELALQYRQDHGEAVYYSGLLLLKTGKGEAAKDYFNELSQRRSQEWKAKGYLGLGLVFAGQQKPEAAENFFEKSLGEHENAEAAAMLALSRRRLGGLEHWESYAKRAFALDPRHPKAVLAMGEVLLSQGKKPQALLHFQKALAKTPNSCDVLAGLAKAQFLSAQYQASRETSASAISRCPEEAEPYYYAAVTSDKLQNRKEAADYFRAYRKAGGAQELLPQEYR